MTTSDGVVLVEEALEKYKQRLEFIDVYENITLALGFMVASAVNRKQEACAVVAEMMTQGDAWATAQMAAAKIRELP